MFNYATKSDLKYVTGVDKSKFPKKVSLASLKSEVDELDVDKLNIFTFDLINLSDVVKSHVVKKTEKLITKVSTIGVIDTSKLVRKNRLPYKNETN